MMMAEKLLDVFSRWSSNFSLDDRLKTLSEFIEFWHGSMGSDSIVVDFSIPGFAPLTLQWFYKMIFKYKRNDLKEYDGDWIEGDPLIIFNMVKRPSDLNLTGDRLVEFLNENQGIFQCAVSCDSNDPPVYFREDDADNWIKLAEKLSNFLLLLLVFELTLNGEFVCSGSFREDTLNTKLNSFLRVNTDKVSWPGMSSPSVLIGEGTAVFSAKNANGMVYLQGIARSVEYIKILESIGEWEFGFYDYK